MAQAAIVLINKDIRSLQTQGSFSSSFIKYNCYSAGVLRRAKEDVEIFLPDAVTIQSGQIPVHEEDIVVEVENKDSFGHVSQNAGEDLLGIRLFFFTLPRNML